MKNSIILILTLLMGSGLYAQYRVSTCEELNLRPLTVTDEGAVLDLLAIYIDGDASGLGGLGCWVHHHPNGKDYVITPHSWGREPTVAKMGLINGAMEAITDSRQKYLEYGTMNNNLYYILDDVRRPDRIGEAFWIINNNECWMQSGVPTMRSISQDDKKQTFAHEIGHCFNMENIQQFEEYYSQNHWFDESVAEYLSSEVYPTNNFEHRFSQLFDMSANFKQEYKAYVLWYYLANQRGVVSIVPLMNALAALSTKTLRLQHLRNIEFDKLFHNFYFDFMTDELPDSGGGIIPNNKITNFMEIFELVPGAPSQIKLDSIPSERLSSNFLQIPADYDLLLHPPTNSSDEVNFSILTPGQNVRDYSQYLEIQGFCDSEKSIEIVASHLNDDPVTGTIIEYELRERKGCCPAGLTVGENPSENELNGKFSFDYYIESNVVSRSAGEENSSPMNYYVNSKDGSMLLTKYYTDQVYGNKKSKDITGFEPEAVIMLPNRQTVAYVYDSNFNQKRAITIDMDQSSSNVLGGGIGATDINELLRNGSPNSVKPPRLPAGSPWHSNSSVFSYRYPEPSNPKELNLVSFYLSNDKTIITSPLPSFGFMVGYVLDSNGKNKKLVFTRVDKPNGDFIETHLVKIENKCYSFDGAGYKKMTLGGFGGVNEPARTKEEQQQTSDSNKSFMKRMEAINLQLMACGDDDGCVADKSKQLMALMKEQQDDAADRQRARSDAGGAGTDFLNNQQVIRDRTAVLTNQMITKNLECERLEDYYNHHKHGNASNERAARADWDHCKEDLKKLDKELEKLQCNMAKLMGYGDMLDNCE